ncbi:uncharacterized protein DSM5745_05682 [Aspergillus mulundensis]|uniref:EF-hand domain-containing protein n=1 Tax=Aspergillus mulundensis TaxID=1810919 RepID=A0A3D8RY87_9EURO|nr:Uncharacterized protein DSM5745_05682 [Aspergillus mulundensis]RDW78830.1 Uncharacterized protein DSM5745_05682 [Aspergillus mulundensis]
MTLCANCYVVQDYPPQHQDDESHPISLHKHSGFLPVPPPPPPRAQPISRSMSSYGPPRRRPVSTANVYSDVPPRKPPRPIPTRPEVEIKEEIKDEGQKRDKNEEPFTLPGPPPPTVSDFEHHSSQHPSPERGVPGQYPEQPEPRFQPTTPSWAPLLTEDMKASLSFTRMIEELFEHLDPQSTGFLSPEAYSQYLEACGAPANHNIWRYSHTKSGTDIADRELTDHFTAYSIDFALHPRTPSQSSSSEPNPLNPLSYLPASQRPSLSRFMPQIPSVSGGRKPMLSLRGFSELALTSVLLNPSSAWSQLNRVIKVYRIPAWLEWGDLPRDMLPLAPYQPEVDRVRVLMEGARARAEEEVDAAHARAKMEQRGRQAALDLLDDRVWVYR